MAFTTQNFQLFFFALVLVLGLWVTQTSARPLDHHKALSLRERHELWMGRHGRVYKNEKEKEKRFNIFKKNIERIENFNSNASSKNKLFTLGPNAFTDLTPEEFVTTHTGYNMHLRSLASHSMTTGFRYENLTDDDISSYMDWREQGAVTDIKYQGQCGCCWAFSAVAAVEGINKIKTGNLVSLSEQEILDCTPGTRGCGGGWMVQAFSFIQQNQGLTTEDAYPYKGYQDQCQATSLGGSVVTINSYETVPQYDESALMNAVSQQPVSVGIDGSGYDFLNYQGGIYNGDCGDDITHAVAVIGYGTDSNGIDFWLLKNSWGESWGENGYMRIIRGQNKCGITKFASYPTI